MAAWLAQGIRLNAQLVLHPGLNDGQVLKKPRFDGPALKQSIAVLQHRRAVLRPLPRRLVRHQFGGFFGNRMEQLYGSASAMPR